jgi:uncharacterized membrane protein YfcA
MQVTELAAVIAIVAAAGLVRGITGFGGAMVMTPPLSLLMGPTTAVATALLLEVIPAAYLLPGAFREMSGRTIAPIFLAACVSIPFGTYLLLNLDPNLARRLIAGVVVLFSLGLLTGMRYAGPQRMATSIGLGLASGFLLGTTGMGAPPVIIYLLSGPDPAARTRANLILFVSGISVAGLIALAAHGALTTPVLLQATMLSPVFFSLLWVGAAVFQRLTDQAFRRATLIALLAISLLIMLV